MPWCLGGETDSSQCAGGGAVAEAAVCAGEVAAAGHEADAVVDVGFLEAENGGEPPYRVVDGETETVLDEGAEGAGDGKVFAEEGAGEAVGVGDAAEVFGGDALGGDPVFDDGAGGVKHAVAGVEGAGEEVGVAAGECRVAGAVEADGETADVTGHAAAEGEIGADGLAGLGQLDDLIAVVDATEQMGAAGIEPGGAFDGFPPEVDGAGDDVGGLGVEEREQFDEPGGFDPDVIIKEGEDLATGFGQGTIACGVEADGGLIDAARGDGHGGGDLVDEGAGLVGAGVSDDDDFQTDGAGRGQRHGAETFERAGQKLAAVVGRDQDGEGHALILRAGNGQA